MGRGDGAMAVMRFSTRRTVNLLRRKIARAIKGHKGVIVHKDHLLQRMATLERTKDAFRERSEGLGIHGIKDFSP
jgi:hypothetical protein